MWIPWIEAAGFLRLVATQQSSSDSKLSTTVLDWYSSGLVLLLAGTASWYY
jgi:hypothetical protein